jgi:hypothetical protein
MCTSYSSSLTSYRTLTQCRASCDSSSECAGFSWGQPNLGVRRRTLLGHDQPAVAGEIGNCYLMSSTPTSSSSEPGFTAAGCYAKGAHLPT